MPETLTAAEFEQRVTRASERLDALRGASRTSAASGGGLPYAGLDLGPEMPELASILDALLHQDPEEPLTHNARLEVGARRLSLAAITTILQSGEGLADFPARYAGVMGADPEYHLFDRLLPSAMREAGLPLPARQDSRRLLESLLASVGLPTSLLEAVARYFVLYWRYFEPLDDMLGPLTGSADTSTLPEAVREELEALAPRLTPNAGVVGPSLRDLRKVMMALRTQHKWRAGDIYAQADDIRGRCGVDPRKVLQKSEAALAILAEGLGTSWHPDQFRHVMSSFPRGGEVRLPSGALAMVDKMIAVPQWGVYRVEGKMYTVLPNEAMTLEEAKSYGERGIRMEGSHLVWRGPTEASASLDEWPMPINARPMFEERAPLGFMLVQPVAPGEVWRVGEDVLPPIPGVHWGASLVAGRDAEGRPHLKIRLRGFSACLPELAGHTLQLTSAQYEIDGGLSIELDDRGIATIAEATVGLVTPGPSPFDIGLRDQSTADVVTLGGRPVLTRIQATEVMLFFEATGEYLAPAETQHPFGPPGYLLFATRPINTSAMQMNEIGTENQGRTGDFEVHRLTWKDADQPLSIYIDGRHQWNFAYRVDATWQAGDLPAAIPPFAFIPDGPKGLTVMSPDALAVDDVSMVDMAMVEIWQSGELLAVHGWLELNWMMNFPAENRRLSGPMLRRLMHVTPDFDLAGHYRIVLRAGGVALGERVLTVLPAMQLEVGPKGLQGEEAVYKVAAIANFPVFPGVSKTRNVTLGSVVVDRDAMENSPFALAPVGASLKLRVPDVVVPIAIVPEVGGFRLLDENEGSWIRKTILSYDELDHITLVLFATGATGESGRGRLTITDGEVFEEDFYEGFATFSMATVQESLRQSETEIVVDIDGKRMGALSIIWHPKILHFEPANEYLVDGVAQIEIKVRGPVDVPVRLEAVAPDGTKLATQDVETDGMLDRTVPFGMAAARDFPIITVRVYDPTEPSGVASGTLEIRNASFEPEIEALNTRIAADPKSADLRYERAQLLLAKGLRKPAARDFQAAIDLGMTELLDAPHYIEFLSQRRAEGFHEDIKALASFFVPFARKELSIG